MFIHFGMSTFLEQDAPYDREPAERYAPDRLDVDQWVGVARDAGMKYAVLTTKHCYGHALWPSQASDYDVTTGGDPTDVVGAFVAACRKYKIEPGFYYLLGWDMHNQVKATYDEYESFVHRQVEELLTQYGPITEMWFDIPWDFGGPDNAGAQARLYAHCKRLQPDCLLLYNQGFYDGSVIVRHPVSWLRKTLSGAGRAAIWPKDLNNGERTVPPESGHNPWIRHEGASWYIPNEVCDSMLQERWFWGPDDDPRPARILYELYRRSVGRNSNLLLNVPPDNTGRIPQEYVERLRELKRMIDRPGRVADSLCWGRPATASNVYRNQAQYGPERAIDIDMGRGGGTRWATDEDATTAWLEVDLGGETRFSRAFVSEYLDRVQAFEIQVPDGSGGWRAVYWGASIGGAGVNVKFKPTTASAVRLAITRSTGGPTLWDFELYEK
ncbi:alpha-L-fucosidase [bacterium]|nr:alpha-L-fucosidase [bacterium]